MIDHKTTAQRKRRGTDPLDQGSYICPICGDRVRPEIRGLHALAERWVIEQIKKRHPEWVEADGLCPKCLDHYRDSQLHRRNPTRLCHGGIWLPSAGWKYD